MIVEVSVPSALVMLRNFPVETVVGSHLQAAVTMKASNGDTIGQIFDLLFNCFFFLLILNCLFQVLISLDAMPLVL